jgi:hypothetical protein
VKKRYINFFCVLLLSVHSCLPVKSQAIASTQPKESTANTLAIPKQILKTGVSLTTSTLAPNTIQLANNIGLIPLLERIRNLRSKVDSNDGSITIETLSARQDLWEAIQKAILVIQKTDLDIDFTMAEIGAEHQVYCEILATYTNDRDKAIARTNAISFISNGALWAVTEALAIPTYKNAKFAIPSGIIGIPAGVVPSIASLWTLKQLNGKKKTSEVEPNMLAKLFGYPTTADIEYPRSIWEYLNQVPADDPRGKKRLDQLVDRWVADSNMPSFTDRHSKKQLDILTASVSRRKGLSIGTLTARSVMLQQLSAEIMKMKRMLLELTMTVQGEKQLTASEPNSVPHIGMQGVP